MKAINNVSSTPLLHSLKWRINLLHGTKMMKSAAATFLLSLVLISFVATNFPRKFRCLYEISFRYRPCKKNNHSKRVSLIAVCFIFSKLVLQKGFCGKLRKTHSKRPVSKSFFSLQHY